MENPKHKIDDVIHNTMKQILENKEIIIIDLKGHPAPTTSRKNYYAVNQNADDGLNLRRKKLRHLAKSNLSNASYHHTKPLYISTMLSTFSPFNSSAVSLMVSSATNFADFADFLITKSFNI